ncbi:hypothetical protein BKA70DRAFT_611735 [Coprinopsis sp. MPI-PUGE-AT-0042]|nr:hypothetical protein BKA70DRAFT_611735 [Coprinopsis sp. MPI-PUGE-AT-0042]
MATYHAPWPSFTSVLLSPSAQRLRVGVPTTAGDSPQCDFMKTIDHRFDTIDDETESMYWSEDSDGETAQQRIFISEPFRDDSEDESISLPTTTAQRVTTVCGTTGVHAQLPDASRQRLRKSPMGPHTRPIASGSFLKAIHRALLARLSFRSKLSS